MSKQIKHCKVCKKPFPAGHNEQVYCSRSCVNRFFKPKIFIKNKFISKENTINNFIKCKQCGKEFVGWKKEQFLCSNKCRKEYFKINPPKVVPLWTKCQGGKPACPVIKISMKPPLWMKEHRYVMEQYLGRKLLKTEIVHHINRDRFDNRIENLELIKNQSEHMAKRHKPPCSFKKGHIPWFIKQGTTPLARHKEIIAQRGPSK